MECNGCTLCCKVLDIPGVSKAGEWCQHCDKGVGCKIHGSDEYPESCKKYGCSYYNVKKANPNLRPDRCGVVIERFNDNIFFGTIDEHIFMFNNELVAQIKLILDSGLSLIFKHLSVPSLIVCEGRDKTSDDVWDEYKKEMKEWQERQHIKQI